MRLRDGKATLFEHEQQLISLCLWSALGICRFVGKNLNWKFSTPRRRDERIHSRRAKNFSRQNNIKVGKIPHPSGFEFMPTNQTKKSSSHRNNFVKNVWPYHKIFFWLRYENAEKSIHIDSGTPATVSLWICLWQGTDPEKKEPLAVMYRQASNTEILSSPSPPPSPNPLHLMSMIMLFTILNVWYISRLFASGECF